MGNSFVIYLLYEMSRMFNRIGSGLDETICRRMRCLGLYLEQFTDSKTHKHVQRRATNQYLWMRSCVDVNFLQPDSGNKSSMSNI